MIKVGDKLPNVTFTVMTADGPKPKTTDDVFKGKKVVLFGLPGAFTPTCHKNHLPGYRDNQASPAFFTSAAGSVASRRRASLARSAPMASRPTPRKPATSKTAINAV